MRGFTLIELLVSIGIIAIITGMVLARYGSFDSTVLLKGQAFEMAATIRDAQFKSVAATRSGADGFDYPYGVSFSVGAQAYDLFVVKNESNSYLPFRYHDDATLVQSFPMGNNMKIDNICIKRNNLPLDCTITRLDVSFRRPEFRSLFYAVGSPSSVTYTSGISYATIEISSTEPDSMKFEVNVSSLGQITP